VRVGEGAFSRRPAPRSLLDGADLRSLRAAAERGGPAALVLACLLEGRAVQHDPDEPEWPDRDRLLVDPALPLRALAEACARAGYPMEEGRLGQGPGRVVAEAVRAARSSLESGEVYRVYLLLAAASLADGQVWAGLVEAGREQLATLTVLVVGAGSRPPRAPDVLRAAGWRVVEAPALPAEVLGALDLALAPTGGDARPGAVAVGSG
jgi:hypothetical protein